MATTPMAYAMEDWYCEAPPLTKAQQKDIEVVYEKAIKFGINHGRRCTLSPSQAIGVTHISLMCWVRDKSRKLYHIIAQRMRKEASKKSCGTYRGWDRKVNYKLLVLSSSSEGRVISKSVDGQWRDETPSQSPTQEARAEVNKVFSQMKPLEAAALLGLYGYKLRQTEVGRYVGRSGHRIRQLKVIAHNLVGVNHG